MADPRALFLSGDVPGALAAYDRAIEAEPDRAALLAGRSAVRLYLGDGAGSAKDADRAVELDANCSAAHLIRARLIEPSNRLQAIAEASRAIDTDGLNTAAYYWRGIWRAGTGDRSGGRSDLAKVAGAEAPDADRLQIRAQAHLAIGDYAAAVRDLDGAIAKGVTLPFMYFFRGLARSHVRDRKGAIEDFGRVIELAPENVAARVERGRERAAEKDAAGALEDFNRAIEIDPNCIPAHYHRASLRAMSDPAVAREDVMRAASTPGSTADDFYFRGRANEDLGRKEDAGDDYARALEAAPVHHPRRAEIEERAAAVPRRKVERARREQRTVPVTIAVTAICILVWLLQFQWKQEIFARGALKARLLWAGEYWRLVTAMFLHGGPMHLFMNMYFGFGFCAVIERMLGSWRFAAAYLLAGVGASAISALFQRGYSVGASGALFGMIGVVLVVYYDRLGSLRAFFHHPEPKRLLWNIAIWTALGVTILPLDNFAHLGGLLFGVLFGLLFIRGPSWRLSRRAAGWAAVLVLLVAVTVGACVPREDRDPESLGDRAEEALQKGDAARAVKLYDEVVRLDPDSPEAYANRGRARLKLERKEEAREDFLKALQLAPPDWPHRKRVQELADASKP